MAVNAAASVRMWFAIVRNFLNVLSRRCCDSYDPGVVVVLYHIAKSFTFVLNGLLPQDRLHMYQ